MQKKSPRKCEGSKNLKTEEPIERLSVQGLLVAEAEESVVAVPHGPEVAEAEAEVRHPSRRTRSAPRGSHRHLPRAFPFCQRRHTIFPSAIGRASVQRQGLHPERRCSTAF